jgi:para-aminobenzoate synthetase/4-amino-4-deoxychorismate lyase
MGLTDLPAAGAPFVLLDDARADGADARLYRDPCAIVIARTLAEVQPALDRINQLSRAGHHLAGWLAYEAGHALEPRLAPLAEARTGADGPLLWFGAFTGFTTIPAAEIPAWLAGEGAIGPLEPQLSIGAYAKAFARLQAAIHAGDIYQANLTFPLAGSWRGDPPAIYGALRRSAGAGYGGLIHDGQHWLLSLSPELFFASDGENVQVKPMKGTRPRGPTPAADAAFAAELAASTKDRAENLMIVDLLRNDLSRVAAPGSVRVRDAFAVETYPTLHQMVSTVTARLEPGRGAVDLIRALFPCGSITGAPKIRAMQLIGAAERDPRGAYCGAIGRIDPRSGQAAFNVAIRTLRLSPDRGEAGVGRAVMGVGSAIVADSAMLAEWREGLVKGGFVRESTPDAGVAQFDLIETMAFTPEGGIALLETHLARLSASAAALGFACDRHAIRNAIQALCFNADRPSRLRLVLARSGAVSFELGAMPITLPEPALCAVLPLPVDPGDWRLRHKTTDRGFYDAGLVIAQREGVHEVLLLRDDGLVTEGCRSTLFVERDGMLLTPPASLGLLPGVLRASLIEAGRAREAELTLDDLADGFFFGNALRGLLPARLA